MIKCRFVVAGLVAIALSASSLHAQEDRFAKAEITPSKVAGSVWMLEGVGGNIGVSAGPDGVLIIDDQFAPLAEKIRAALKGISPGKLSFVINTHWHGDHVGGNPIFGKEATILAHDNVRARLLTRPEPFPKEGLPVITYADGLSVWFNSEEIRVMHVPRGHTDGDSVILFKGSNVAHMGDQFFNGMFPFVDVASGGTVAGYTKNIADMIAKLPKDVKIIPGHGPLATVEDLTKAHAMLEATSDHVKKAIAAGMSLEEAKKAGLPDEWKGWATSFVPVERWVETLYKSLE